MTARFLLNGAPVTVADERPDRMLLGWLRERAGLTGTKEGCAEGDCGACTVALGEVHGDGLRWRAVNACILFLGSVHGKAVLTVEGLEAPDGALHPAQQALVDHHGSQCGFCTPGFAMTLFTHWWRGGPSDRASLDALLAGNLCRCTGYRPILDAARAMATLPGGEHLRAAEPAMVARLRAWRDECAAPAAGFVRPRTVDALAAHLEAHPDALLVAGGTDAGLWVTKALRRFERVVTTDGVDALATVEARDGVLDLGAAVTWTDLLPHAHAHWPDFGRVLERFGSELIRNSATIGGNIGSASPIGDGLPVLLALGARLVLRQGGAQREVAIDDYFQGYKRTALVPGEFVERVHLPLPEPDFRLVVEKISKRFDQDISAVLVAVAARVGAGHLEAVRIAMGGMAAVPKRAARAEAALEGAAIDDDGAFEAARDAVAADFEPITDMRASAHYRLEAARAVLAKAALALRGAPVRLPHAPLEPVS